jgi:hypothetical protein
MRREVLPAGTVKSTWCASSANCCRQMLDFMTLRTENSDLNTAFRLGPAQHRPYTPFVVAVHSCSKSKGNQTTNYIIFQKQHPNLNHRPHTPHTHEKNVLSVCSQCFALIDQKEK